jgi:hypothetical protein
MSIQFPATPTQGQTFIASNGVSYTYDNGGWIANSQSALDDRFVDLDGDTMTGDLTVPSLNGGPLAGFRNQFINGDFRIWQRGTSTTLAVAGFTADRWATAGQGSTSAQRNRYGGIPIFESNNAGYMWQPVELYRDPSGDSQNVIPAPFTVGSVWTLSYYASAAPHPSISQIARFRDGNNTDVNEVPIATLATPTATGRTLGSGNELVQYSTTFTVTGTPNQTNTCATFFIAGNTANVNFAYAQLEPGPVCTPFEQRPLATELALCQRFYETGRYYGQSGGAAGGAWGDTINFASTKRVNPTNTFANTVGTVNGQDSPRASSIGFYGTPSAGGEIAFGWTADAEL